MPKARERKVVIITGGNGALASGPGLISYGFDLTSICNTFNSGGSAKKIMDEFGEIHDPGDVRRALWALQGPNAGILGRIFDNRFDNTGGNLGGHVVGNIVLAAAQQELGSYMLALKEVGRTLDVHARVLPISMDRATVIGRLSDGSDICGEDLIDRRPLDDYRRLEGVRLSPRAFISREAAEAITQAHVAVLGPGDIFSSLAPMLCVEGLADVLRDSQAKLVLVMNLMTKHAETHGFAASDFARALLSYRIGRARFDAIIASRQLIPQPVQEKYWRDEKAAPVVIDKESEQALQTYAGRIICCDKLLSDEGLRRQIVRHDPRELGRCIAEIAMNEAE